MEPDKGLFNIATNTFYEKNILRQKACEELGRNPEKYELVLPLLDKRRISVNKTSDEFLNMYSSFINWNVACQYQTLSSAVIIKNIGKMDLTLLCKYQKLEPEILFEKGPFLDWYTLCKYQDFPVAVGKKYSNYLHRDALLMNTSMNPSTKEILLQMTPAEPIENGEFNNDKLADDTDLDNLEDFDLETDLGDDPPCALEITPLHKSHGHVPRPGLKRHFRKISGHDDFNDFDDTSEIINKDYKDFYEEIEFCAENQLTLEDEPSDIEYSTDSSDCEITLEKGKEKMSSN